jgi:hypothetical protein
MYLIPRAPLYSQNYVVLIYPLFVYETTVFCITFTNQSEDVVSNDSFGESDFAVAEVVCMSAIGQVTLVIMLTKPFALEHLNVLGRHFWVLGDESRVDFVEIGQEATTPFA